MNTTPKKLRVLAVAPRFAPLNAADSHRLRLLVPHALSQGWDVEVLAVEPTDISPEQDEWLAQQLPASVVVHHVRCSKIVSVCVNSVALRALWPLYTRGARLLTEGQFDLVFFSTTEFVVHVLGVMWKRRFGVPFCMDYQDPWVNEYYDTHPDVPKPGGNLKYTLMHKIDRYCERRVVANCGGFLAVSAHYLEDLQQRYGAVVAGKPQLVRGFPGEPAELMASLPVVPAESSTTVVWRYIGRGGADMAKSAQAFFLAWQRAVAEGIIKLDQVRFEARGTSYASASRAKATLAPLSAAMTVRDRISEDTDRLPYSRMLALLRQSDALIVFGSDDAAYTASKIYPYLLAGKPLLAIFHRDSSVVQLMRRVGGGICTSFTTAMEVDELAAAIYSDWFASGAFTQTKPLDVEAFKPYTAAVQAAEVAQWFNSIVAREAGNTKI